MKPWMFYCLSEGRELEVSSSVRTLKRPGTAWGAPVLPSPFPLLLAPHVTSRRSNSFSRSSRLSTFYNVCIKIMLMTLKFFKGTVSQDGFGFWWHAWSLVSSWDSPFQDPLNRCIRGLTWTKCRNNQVEQIPPNFFMSAHKQAYTVSMYCAINILYIVQSTLWIRKFSRCT